jgi:hypothetical protein
VVVAGSRVSPDLWLVDLLGANTYEFSWDLVQLLRCRDVDGRRRPFAVDLIDELDLNESTPPVCVAGMHRSGTSTVAQLLCRLGLYLGREEDLFAPGPSNPEGYWENKHFVRINEDLLNDLGAGWDFPPDTEPGWQRDERLQPRREAAESLMREFREHGRWGWKDPRNCLTMPFWLDLLPDARVVVCLRNPVEVVLSLRKRGNASLPFGLNLWRTYNERLLADLPEDKYIVTHYESYFQRPQQELRRVLDFCGMPASDQLISQVRSRVIKGLRNHFYTLEEMLELDASGKVRDLYLRMCAEADWNPELASFPKTLEDHELAEL